MRLGGSLALPISTGFEFFHTFRDNGITETAKGMSPSRRTPATSLAFSLPYLRRAVPAVFK